MSVGSASQTCVTSSVHSEATDEKVFGTLRLACRLHSLVCLSTLSCGVIHAADWASQGGVLIEVRFPLQLTKPLGQCQQAQTGCCRGWYACRLLVHRSVCTLLARTLAPAEQKWETAHWQEPFQAMSAWARGGVCCCKVLLPPSVVVDMFVQVAGWVGGWVVVVVRTKLNNTRVDPGMLTVCTLLGCQVTWESDSRHRGLKKWALTSIRTECEKGRKMRLKSPSSDLERLVDETV